MRSFKKDIYRTRQDAAGNLFVLNPGLTSNEACGIVPPLSMTVVLESAISDGGIGTGTTYRFRVDNIYPGATVFAKKDTTLNEYEMGNVTIENLAGTQFDGHYYPPGEPGFTSLNSNIIPIDTEGYIILLHIQNLHTPSDVDDQPYFTLDLVRFIDDKGNAIASFDNVEDSYN